MTVVYIGYWGANEGLSVATIWPHLKILSELGIKRIVYISIERANEQEFKFPDIPGLHHVPLYTDKYPSRLLNKLYDFLLLPRKILSVVKKETPYKVFCRSTLAGYFGHYIFRKTGIPYIVESMEPHVDYMVETGVWSKNGLSAKLQNRWEKNQFEMAEFLLPVTEGYKKKLVSRGINEEKIKVMPCAVDVEKFLFKPDEREELRQELKIAADDIVGIYVGKIGGIYYSLQDSIEIFKQAFQHFKNFYLLILTPQDPQEIKNNLNLSALRNRFTVLSVSHDEVPNYLSASDFAFSLHYPTPSMRYVSPIKNGEYWANGLPILISKGIGDDHEIIENNEAKGAVFSDISNISRSLESIRRSLKKDRLPDPIIRWRSFLMVRECYSEILNTPNA